ncbi:hypothetical protein J2793_007381 [Paraburkholderia caledonica]|uniref:Uncharacterized protein n=1 Tax=Paraburkholderia caledonica TaxID=134536 RepID=A0AB73IPH8_9BURK|nr:hypothetical protein [Paraburkholderia caledonica]
MIHDPQRLREVIEEIADWPTKQQRIEYIASIGQAFSEAAAQQIRDGLTRLWAERNK